MMEFFKKQFASITIDRQNQRALKHTPAAPAFPG